MCRGGGGALLWKRGLEGLHASTVVADSHHFDEEPDLIKFKGRIRNHPRKREKSNADQK